jgi:hypothetical protein
MLRKKNLGFYSRKLFAQHARLGALTAPFETVNEHLMVAHPNLVLKISISTYHKILIHLVLIIIIISNSYLYDTKTYNSGS